MSTLIRPLPARVRSVIPGRRQTFRAGLAILVSLTAAAGLALAPQRASAATFTFQVTSTNDTQDAAPGDGKCADASNVCTLRAGIQESNALPAGSIVTIKVPAGTYLLSSAFGPLSMTSNNVTVLGAGSSSTIIDAQNGFRVFSISNTATIQAVSIQHGSADVGAGILNGGTLKVRTSVLQSNVAGNQGGALYNFGSATIYSSTFSGNIAVNGGGILNANGGTLTIEDSAVATNTATSAGTFGLGGGGLYNLGLMNVTHDSFTGNQAYDGAGILSNGSASSTIKNSTIGPGNQASDSGGGALIFSPVTFLYDTFTGNIAANAGGGLYNAGTLAMTHTTIGPNNSATNGGGVANYNTVPFKKLGDNTYSGNTASNLGGGLYNFGSTWFAVYDTYANNSTDIATDGGGFTQIVGSIVANSTSGPNCNAPLSEGVNGANLDSGSSCGFTKPASLSNTNPMLGPLANNGGPTQTQALLAGSPAIDHGLGSTNGCPPSDERGNARPDVAGSQCDIGAYETSSNS